MYLFLAGLVSYALSVQPGVFLEKRLPLKTQKKLKDKGITIALEKRRGRAIDLPMDKMLQIIELRKDYQTVREIEKITGIPKSTVHYLLKYADRGKIKKGQNVVYLK